MKMITTISEIKKGDLVTYKTGRTKYVNDPDSYKKYFNEDFYNPLLNMQIVKIQRYKKILCFYKLKIVYEKKRGESRWI